MPDSLTLVEQETHLNMTGDNHKEWDVYSDDPVMQRRIEKLGIEPYKTTNDGVGRFYKMRADQVVLRKGKRYVSEQQREKARQRLKKWHETRQDVG